MLLLLAMAACAPAPDGPVPLIAGEGFFDRPWPSDSRSKGGHPDLTGFPKQGENGLVDSMLREGELLDGYGINSPIYLRFDRPLDLAALPDPIQSLDPENGLYLLDIDPRSPERGRSIPFRWDFQQEATNWQPENLLAVQPVWGLPLRSGTRYALVLGQELFSPPTLDDGSAFPDSLAPSHPDSEGWRDLVETLFSLDVDTASVAFATQFTTQDATSDMAWIVARMDEALPLTPPDPNMTYGWGNERYQAYSGVVRVPIWQQGQAPYTTEGGGFLLDDRGWPTLVNLDAVEFTLTIPRSRTMPAAGWPVVVYGHGTGGDRWTFANSRSPMEVASVLAERGIAGLGISLPFHGDRYQGGNVELLSFNYLNPESGRATFRQAALEQIWLTRLLSHQATQLRGPGGFTATLDPDRVAYLGHSHGAEIGIIAAPFFGPGVKAVALSGGGGGLSVSIVERDAGDFDIQGLLSSALAFAPDEELDLMHPVVGMVQFVAEATDPLNYADAWFHAAQPYATTPAHVLVIHGLQDVHTPPSTVGALAAAAHLPILAPIGQTWDAQEFVDPRGEVLPLGSNIVAFDCSRVTGGVLQYPDQDHFAIFQDPAAAKAYGDFLLSALSGQPRIESR